MNETTPTPSPQPDDQRGPQPDEHPTAVLGEQPDPDQQAGPYQPPAYQPPASQAPGPYQAPPGFQAPDTYPGAFQQTGAYPQPGSYPPPTGTLPPRPPSPPRRLTRSRSQRVLGGVCGGLARYWNTDPLLLRILTIVLTLATGGALLIGYLIAWIAIPDEPTGPVGAYGQFPEQVGYAAGGNPGYAEPGFTAQYEVPAPRARSHLGWLTLSIAVLVMGVLALIGLFVPTSVGFWGVILGATLVVLGLGLIVGSRYGRARWLIWLAVPLTFLTFGTVSAANYVADNPNWGRWTEATSQGGQWGGLTFGDRTWSVTPADVPNSPLTYRLSAGTAVLDLSELTALGDAESARPEQRVEIDAGVGVGELIILIAPDAQMDLTGSVRVGEVHVPGAAPMNGSDLEVDTTVESQTGGQPAYLITVDAVMGAGNLEVRHEAA